MRWTELNLVLMTQSSGEASHGVREKVQNGWREPGAGMGSSQELVVWAWCECAGQHPPNLLQKSPRSAPDLTADEKWCKPRAAGALQGQTLPTECQNCSPALVLISLCPSLAASKAAAGHDFQKLPCSRVCLGRPAAIKVLLSIQMNGKILFTLIVLKCIAKTSPKTHTFL